MLALFSFIIHNANCNKMEMHRKVTSLHETCGNNYYIAPQQISVDSMWRREVV